MLVLGGITRLLRSFFPFLQVLENFSEGEYSDSSLLSLILMFLISLFSGWERLLHFVRDSISNGSKEVALAAVSCLQTTVMSNCPKVERLTLEFSCKTSLLIHRIPLQTTSSSKTPEEGCYLNILIISFFFHSVIRETFQHPISSPSWMFMS